MDESAAARPSRARWWVRVEDAVLAVWVAVVAPALFASGPAPAGPFEPGRPIDGLLGLGAVLGVAVCLALRRPDAPQGRGSSSWGAVGPLVGGLLLVVVHATTSLGMSGGLVFATALVFAAVALVARRRWPAPSAAFRRALVTPYLAVAGGMFWDVIAGVTSGGELPAQIRRAAASDLGAVLPIVGFLLLYSAVHYAMLVFAPRQVAEREGGVVVWLVRYAVFAASLLLGAGWLVVLAG